MTTNPAPHVGTGVNLFATEDISGTARWFENTTDVLSIDDEDLPDTIAFVHKGGMTFLSPILPDLKAIVCTAGSRESHLAILSRESAVPCVLAADITTEIPSGARVRLGLSDPDNATIDIVTTPAVAS
ncbi:PEP-utilizing enzyme [Nocardia higoensis]|uniref:PEP-utilizing enzyme n=1 Tax=Nocardia higoensis TaxID=228599 RepID=UPI0002DF1EF1|nr:PEP-utilizing enzyme [Nocardia higoensis]